MEPTPLATPLIYSYLKRFQDDPTSKVFAPLAEAYRKAGLVNEAIEVAREGLQVHPQFAGGRVALARALFDKKDYGAVCEELTPVVRDHPDNLMAQKLFAEASLILGRTSDALGAYKMLLYLLPSDPEVSHLVQELESRAYDEGRLVVRSDPPAQTAASGGSESASNDESGFLVRELGGAIADDPVAARLAWIARVERLQGWLQRVERYRAIASKS